MEEGVLLPRIEVGSSSPISEVEDLNNLCELLQEEMNPTDPNIVAPMPHLELGQECQQYTTALLNPERNQTSRCLPMQQQLDHVSVQQSPMLDEDTQASADTDLHTNSSELYLECHDDETNDILLSEQIESLRKEREAEEAQTSGMTVDINAGSTLLYRISFPKHDSPNDKYGRDRVKTASRVVCDQCKKTFTRLSLLLDHKAVVHNVKDMFRCYLCDYTGQRYGHWYKHMRRMHPTAKAVITDDHVTGNITTPALPTQSGISEYEKAVISDSEECVTHVFESNKYSSVLKQRPETISQLTCHTNATNSSKQLIPGVLSHPESPVNHQCPKCPKAFPNKRSLMYHKRTHTVKTHVCNVPGCSKVFKNCSALNEHKLTVHGKRVYACSHEGCSRTYAVKRDLDYHRRTHTNVYACPVCGRKCRDTFNLSIHTKTHSKEKSLHCNICEYACIQKSAMKLHKLRKHNNVITKTVNR